MSKEDIKEQYINFDEYIRQGEPAQRERAEAWRVDGPEEWKMPESEQAPNKLPNK